MNIAYNVNALHKASSPYFTPDAIYQALKHGIKDEELVLAKRSVNGNNYQWTIPNVHGEVWHKLGESSSLEQNAVMNLIGAYKKKAAQVLGVGQEEIDAIFSTPNDSECIYFCNAGGKQRVSIVGWDFVSSGADAVRGVITADPIKLKQEVVISFVKNGKPLAGCPFVLSLPSGFSKSYTMPANGMFRLGSIDVGVSINININNGQIIDEITVIKDKTVYEFDVTVPKPEPKLVSEPVPAPEPESEPELKPEPEPELDEPEPESETEPSLKKTAPQLRVVDAAGNTVSSFPINILYPNGNSEHVFSDEDGECRLAEMTEGETFIAKDGFTDKSISFTIQADRTEYLLVLDYTTSIQNPDIKIKVVDVNEKPIYPGRIALVQIGTTLLITLEENGIFYLSDGYFKVNTPIEVKLVNDRNDEYSSKDFAIVRDEKEYVIQLDIKKCPVWMKLLECVCMIAVATGCVIAYEPVYEILSAFVESTY